MNEYDSEEYKMMSIACHHEGDNNSRLLLQQHRPEANPTGIMIIIGACNHHTI